MLASEVHHSPYAGNGEPWQITGESKVQVTVNPAGFTEDRLTAE